MTRTLLAAVLAALLILGAMLALAAGLAHALSTGGEAPIEVRLRAQLRLERDQHERHVRRLWRTRAPTVASAFALANVVYGVPVGGLSRLAWCESRHRPWARNGTALGGSHASGLTQILYPSTWGTTPYASLSPFDAAASALAAGYIWRRAGGSFREWADVCADYGNG